MESICTMNDYKERLKKTFLSFGLICKGTIPATIV